jgi:hypothetical protein
LPVAQQFILPVDNFEDVNSPKFNEAQQISTSCSHLIEEKHIENGLFRESRKPPWAVDRFPLCGLFSIICKIDHLSKEQVVASDGADQQLCWRLSLVETGGNLILNFNYTRWGVLASSAHLSEFK